MKEVGWPPGPGGGGLFRPSGFFFPTLARAFACIELIWSFTCWARRLAADEADETALEIVGGGTAAVDDATGAVSFP